MNRSESINELATALAKAQGEMKPAKKDAENPFFKSHYADLPSIVDAAKPLAKHGLSFVQPTEATPDGIFVETVLLHSSGQWISGRYPVKPVKDDPQGWGSALTYSRRYGLSALIGVVAADEDDDAEAAHGHTAKPALPGGAAQPTAIPKNAAAQWAKEAEAAVKACPDTKALTAWEEANAKAMVKLHSVDSKAHERLMEIIQDKYERMNPLAA
jgi:ERF superfamily